MKRLLLILGLGLAMLMSSCVKTHEEPLHLNFSVLGDSFSSFKGYVYPDDNEFWYYSEYGVVTDVEQMWWFKVASKMEWVLDKNNSYSGSLISNFWGYNAGPYYSPHSFIRRMDNLGDPDVIFVFGGTNDVWVGAYSGDYVYSGWTDAQLEQYRPALAYLFDGLQRLYPRAKLYFLIDTSLSDFDHSGQEFDESVHAITRHYHIECIDLYGIHKDWEHPNAKGQDDIARQVIEVLRNDFNV